MQPIHVINDEVSTYTRKEDSKMPLISLIPTNDYAEGYLEAETANLRPRIKALISELCKVPLKDVIVRAFRNTILDSDPDDADVHMRLENNPNEKMEAISNIVRDQLALLWKEHYSQSEEYGSGETNLYVTLEIWKQFIPGSWGLSLASEGELLTEKVDHPNKDSPETPHEVE